ncbi:histidine kinase [Neolewinella agarilytica]|uniref:Tetratricopeptide repeat-containing protein n=2 Tax=Neolewinella agarilytica TaxID=478744 RepID=A0A1H8ZDW6_9BACT|nr:histidine kinase [Neolewinella agarilytica]SEP62535.1 Tetratricopeptide repeat-containing protein [Neolewinella agarilytica]
MITNKSLIYLVVVAFLLQSCVGTTIDFISTSKEESPKAMLSKSSMIAAGIDPEKIDELTDYLRPYLSSNLGDRRLENWYINRTNWIDLFTDRQNVLYAAEIVFEECLQEGNLSKAANVKNAISRIYSNDGDFPEALNACEESLKLAKRAQDSIAIGWTMMSISSNFTLLHDFPSAKEYGYKTLAFARSIEHPAIEAGTLNVLGGIIAYQSKYDSAIAVINQSIDIARQHGLKEIEKRGILNVSYNYNRLNRFDESIEFLNQNIDFKEISTSISNIFLCFNLQSAYLGKNEFEMATFYLDRGCEMADEVGFVYAQMFCEKYRTELLKAQGLYSQALAAMEKVNQIQTKLMGIEQTRSVQSMKTRLKLLDKDIEIEKRKEQEKFYQIRLRGSAAISAFLALFIPGIYFFMRNRQKRKTAEQQKLIAETKLQALQSQMHPHFIFNALGGVQNYILKSEKIEAYKYLGKFATLLRSITKSTTQVHIELDQEIEFIQSYLDMEKLRFREDFTYSLSVAPSLINSKEEIPSMVIQPAVENAILHGLAGLTRQGELTVEFKPDENGKGIWCVVTDNGRGRVAAKKNSQDQQVQGHLSIATINTSERIACLRLLGYDNVDASIEDLYEHGEASGTRVTIFLPFMHADQLVTP